ncbi:hypothetical protein MTO96_002451 [Rhipicephalus appendiculatus]
MMTGETTATVSRAVANTVTHTRIHIQSASFPSGELDARNVNPCQARDRYRRIEVQRCSGRRTRKGTLVKSQSAYLNIQQEVTHATVASNLAPPGLQRLGLWSRATCSADRGTQLVVAMRRCWGSTKEFLERVKALV